ncbi:hypothetical protein CNMCM5623_004361 [Aspergillus felis]|uniref:Heterokaryon incompatibility domain-containing protein n=1 Tax=Aspergillus felis TaxID=1287682 RepID=A0A8H6QGI2_9EURO|nr:hypothetical protein CNMCM5623_004361 [Aspergillus felis]
MDHLPTPQGTLLPEVPYVATEYDGGGFNDFPTRHGLSSDLRTLSFTRLSPEEYISLFQTWLYIGCLVEVSRITEIPIDLRQFVRKATGHRPAIVTSASLNTYLDKWKSRESAHKKAERPVHRLRRIQAVLKTVRDTLLGPLQSFRVTLDDVPGRAARSTWPTIALSIAAMGYTLQRVSDDIYVNVGGRRRLTWGVDWVLEARMEKMNWCKAQIAKFLDEEDLDFLLFVSCTASPRAFENHDECTGAVCRGRIINTAGYRTKHVSETCQCQFWETPSSFTRIIERDGIPLVQWTERGLNAVGYQEGMPYVAISHVWSDGKGNENHNALPECQLRKIHGYIQQLYKSPRPEARPSGLMFGPSKSLGFRDPWRKPVGFWMDTLCVPVGSTQEQMRKKTIQKMRDIYESADRVLVLDDRIKELSVSSNIVDRAVRLVVSNWQSRIWTLQEGVMAQQLFFQFTDGALTLGELTDEEVGQRRGPSPGSFHRVSHRLLTMLSLGLVFPSREARPRTDELFEALMPVARNRMTTKMEDETVCLSTLLDVDRRPMLNIKTNKSKGEWERMTSQEQLIENMRVCDERMRVFLCHIGRFRKSLIFHELPRLSTDGFRWAPRSYLGQSGAIVPDDPEQFLSAMEGHAVLLDKDSPPGRGKKSSMPLDPNKVIGLLVSYPGLLIHSGNLSSIKRGTFYVREKGYKVWEYRASLKPTVAEENYIDKMTVEKNQFVLVTIASLTSEHRKPIPAMLGVVTGEMKAGATKLRYLCLATVEVMRQTKVIDHTASEPKDEGRQQSQFQGYRETYQDSTEEDSDEEEEEEEEGEDSEVEDSDSDSYEGEGEGEGGWEEVAEESEPEQDYLDQSDEDEEHGRHTATEGMHFPQQALVYGEVIFSRNREWCIQ